MADPSTVTVVIITYRTPDLTRCALNSFRTYYADTPLLLIDNGSDEEGISVLEEFRMKAPGCTEVIRNSRNLHHGPAMHQALRHIHSRYALFLDSDSETRKGGFVENMVSLADRGAKHYAVGKRVFLNNRGFDVDSPERGFAYIRPICMLIKRDSYLTLPPFRHHGSPCLQNMIEARKRGFILLDFLVEEYILHKGRGTAGKYGYDLGWRGKINYVLNKMGL